MKKNYKLLAVCLASCAALVGLTGCQETSSSSSSSSSSSTVALADAKTAALAAFQAKLDEIDHNAYDDEALEVLAGIKSYGELFINESTTNEQVAANLSIIEEKLAEFTSTTKKLANGVYSFVASSYAERTKILAALEKYAVDNFLTGITLMDDGGYSLYRPEVKRGVDKYITGYGWGTLSDGEITADLANEANPAWKRYYHTFVTENPTHLNYGDDKGSVVGDLLGYVASGYWGTRMNETKDGYEWYSDLAKEMPQAVNASEQTGLATKYSWKLKTGKDGLKYNTLTSKDGLSAYAGREVAAEDYLTSYKMLFTKAHNWARGAESLTGSGSIKGMEAYYNGSGNGYDETLWENVGLKVEEVDGEAVMTVEFNVPCSPFYAMYYMSSSIHSPVPMDFVKELGEGDFAKGAALYQKTNLDKGLSPVDTTLACGPYVVESWSDDAIVFKKNTLFDTNGKYNIAGVHFDILTAATQDPLAAFNEFMAGNLHACGLPSKKLDEYKTLNDPEIGYAVYNPGSSTFKLNVNACDQETWIDLFGKNGSVTVTTEDKYWECEPAMSNSDFLLGLSYAINRKEFADKIGVGASVDYLGSGYLSDPENGIAYSDSEEHKAAIGALTQNGQIPDGYDLEIAKSYFDKALATMTADGTYVPGDEIVIEIAWQTTSNIDTYGTVIKQYFEDAFKPVGEKYGVTLKVENWAGAVWSDVYYKKMMLGQFDIGFGSISGNSLNPLNFMEVLKSDNSSGFTLNWGSHTNEVEVEYNDEMWSFDSLWQASETGGYFEKGQFVKNHDSELLDQVMDPDWGYPQLSAGEDGKVVCKIDTNMLQGIEGLTVEVEKVVLNGYLGAEQEYTEFECAFTVDADGVVTVTLEGEGLEAFTTNNTYYLAYGINYAMVDVIFNVNVLGIDTSTYDSIDVLLPLPAAAE